MNDKFNFFRQRCSLKEEKKYCMHFGGRAAGKTSYMREEIIQQIRNNIKGLEYFTEFGTCKKRRFLIVNGGIFFNEVPLILNWLELRELYELHQLIQNILLNHTMIINMCEELKVRDLKE